MYCIILFHDIFLGILLYVEELNLVRVPKDNSLEYVDTCIRTILQKGAGLKKTKCMGIVVR